MTYLKAAGIPSIEIIDLITCLGDKIDIIPLFQGLVLYEDIFAPCLNGNITISDTLGLFDKLPISSNEKLVIKFYSYNYSDQNQAINYIHRTFDVLRVDNLTNTKDFQKVYTLYFASPEYKQNELLKISKSYKKFTTSQIVSQIMTSDEGLKFPTTELAYPVSPFGRSPYISSAHIEAQYENVTEENAVELFIEKTKNEESCITFPYTKPFDMIQNLSNKSLRLSPGRYGVDQYEIGNFLFFENKRGFQFVSLETLFENKEINSQLGVTFRYGNAAQNHQGLQRSVVTETIERLQIQRSYDIIKNINAGMYSSCLITYDIHTGETNTVDYDYMDDFYKSETTNRDLLDPKNPKDYPPIYLDDNNKNDITQQYNSRRLFIPILSSRDENNITGSKDFRNNEVSKYIGPEQYIQKRLSCLSRLNNFKLQFEISANSRHKVGDCVYIDLTDYKFREVSAGIEQFSSKYYSGYYLITSIKHILTPLSYKMHIEAVIDSYNSKIGEIQ